ncbi:MAG: DUF4124 domain-containing protein [Gammaproteobacteria bacterium]|jgi:hypothetical protein|nr:DUF4124 domain-containing protein [Gammaproteobacteria bacterium]MBU2180810.1 DUF4124 domain-containing protein [Gammaproteobacteria bacterium]MBU2223909.1 DUF4124 domain-containing protein [Gammaproteobacteria bacterium]MBU2278455.1 DUF4124 domain-containing protein [Gammaproteobacteria bacterium]MBU2426884.1 DUF4124 domain-containing protein [Gammaproteobacteria bacterium]
MKKALWLLLLTCLAASAAEDKKVFVTVDKNNNLVFSDSPSPGATQVTVKETATAMVPPNPGVSTSVVKESTTFEVAISKPEQQGTVRENSGTVYVSGQIKPMFAQGLRVKLYLDGKQVAGPTGNANFILHNVDRGEHQLTLELLDQSGKIIATSPVTTFYLHRASAISPK